MIDRPKGFWPTFIDGLALGALWRWIYKLIRINR